MAGQRLSGTSLAPQAAVSRFLSTNVA